MIIIYTQNLAVQVYVHSRRNSTIGGSVTSQMIEQVNSKSLLQKLQNLETDKNHLSATNYAFEPVSQENKDNMVERRKISFKDEQPLKVQESTLSIPTIVVNDLSH